MALNFYDGCSNISALKHLIRCYKIFSQYSAHGAFTNLEVIILYNSYTYNMYRIHIPNIVNILCLP